MTLRATSVAATLLAMTLTARAGELNLLTDSQQAWVGVPLTVAIDVTFQDSHDEPAFPDLPNPRWVALRLLGGDDSIVEALRSGQLGRLQTLTATEPTESCR